MRKRGQTRGVVKHALISRQSTADVFFEQYETVRDLGEGSFGRVSLVRDRQTDEERVLKVINIAGMPRHVVDMMLKEIELLKSLDHPLIMRLYEFAEDKEKQEITLLTEFISGGDGLGLLVTQDGRATRAVAERTVSTLVRNLLLALHYCHERGVVHRDVKPDNLMLPNALGSNGEAVACKLIDFGLAGKSANSDGTLSDIAGTPKFMPPEMHRKQPYNTKADIWSAGVTALYFLLGHSVFERPYEETIARYQGFHELEARWPQDLYWQKLSLHGKDFCRKMLQADPNHRPSAADALQHEWIQAHEPPPAKFTKQIGHSLVNYAGTHAIIRSCLFAIAARSGAENLDRLGAAFLGADADRDGVINREDLEAAVMGTEGYSWWWNRKANVNVDDVLAAADLGHTGTISFTEFVAACSFDNHGSLRDIAEAAFFALDSDRDGLVKVQEIQPLFRERDSVFLKTLPQNRSFDIDEWCECVEDWTSSPESIGTVSYCSSGSRSSIEASRGAGLFQMFAFSTTCRRRVSSGSQVEVATSPVGYIT